MVFGGAGKNHGGLRELNYICSAHHYFRFEPTVTCQRYLISLAHSRPRSILLYSQQGVSLSEPRVKGCAPSGTHNYGVQDCGGQAMVGGMHRTLLDLAQLIHSPCFYINTADGHNGVGAEQHRTAVSAPRAGVLGNSYYSSLPDGSKCIIESVRSIIVIVLLWAQTPYDRTKPRRADGLIYYCLLRCRIFICVV